MARKKLAYSISRNWLTREYLFNWDWLDSNDWTKVNASVINWVYVFSDVWYQKQVLSAWATTTVTYASITYTESYLYYRTVAWVWTFEKNSTKVSSTALTCTNWERYAMLRFYNRTLSQQEIQILNQEWLRQLAWWSDNILSSAIAYYDFNDISTPWIAQDVIGWYNGTVSGATPTTDRFWVANRAYSFTWWNDKIRTWIWTSVLNINNPHTYFFWIKTAVSSTWQQQSAIYLWNRWVYSPTDHWDWIEVNSAWTTIWYTQYDWTAVTANFTCNLWQLYHWVAVHDWTNLNLYIDWVLRATVAKRAPNINSASRLTFWWPEWAETNYWFNWTFEEIWVIPRWLSAWEVKQLYETSKAKYLYPFKKTFPLSLNDWKILHLTGDVNWTTAYDISWNGNNGTLVNSPTISRSGQHKVINLNWSNQYVNIPNSAIFDLQNMTIYSIVKFNIVPTSGGYVFFEKWPVNTQYSLFIELVSSVVNLRFRTYNSSWIDHHISVPVSLIAWKQYHIACTYNWTNKKLFLNWVEIWSVPYTETLRTWQNWERIW
jgi:hypothetical protein